ncbi:MAG: hypothetical protein KDN05_08550, partial [Verrucomicrobiae bacterium]|nr:hypothetical protein [Verrucomicrobiae bacterium]
MKFAGWFAALLVSPVFAADSFEDVPAGGFESIATTSGTWTAAAGHAEVHAGHAKEGRQSIRLVGGGEKSMELRLPQPLAKPGRLTFWAERWTSRGPFVFRIDAAGASGGFEEVWNGDAVVKVGGFHTKVEVPMEKGVSRLRFRCTAPEKSGVMLDLMEIAEEKPMRLVEVDVSQPVVPVLRGKALNPVLGLRISTEGALKPLVLEAVEVSMEGTTRIADVEEIALVSGGEDPGGDFGPAFGGTASGGRVAFGGAEELDAGDNWWWVSVKLKDSADI